MNCDMSMSTSGDNFGLCGAWLLDELKGEADALLVDESACEPVVLEAAPRDYPALLLPGGEWE